MGGAWKRTPLPVPVAAGLRPTPSRVRETLFNWLGQDLSGWRVLDAFAGSGALGLEAASRGAEQVQLLERDPALAKSLKAIQAKLGASQVQVWQTEALSWMRQSSRAGQFDLVFIDPPFDDDLFESALLAALNCVVDGGWVYLEASCSFEQLASPDLQAALKLHRHGQAGAVHFHLFERVASASGAAPTAD
jgi:16S rRNA (guanine966-N2)-methyltransferase